MDGLAEAAGSASAVDTDEDEDAADDDLDRDNAEVKFKPPAGAGGKLGSPDFELPLEMLLDDEGVAIRAKGFIASPSSSEMSE